MPSDSPASTWITHFAGDGLLTSINSVTGTTIPHKISDVRHGTEISRIELYEDRNLLRLSYVAQYSLEHLQVDFVDKDNPNHVTTQAQGLLAGIAGINNAYMSPKGQFRIKFKRKYDRAWVNFDVIPMDSETFKSDGWVWAPTSLCPRFPDGEHGAKSFLIALQNFLGQEPYCTVCRTPLLSFS